MPRVIILELQQKYGVTITNQQMSEYIKTRGWSKQRKKMSQFMTPDESSAIAIAADIKSKAIMDAAADNKLGAAELHQEFLTATARVAAKALKKAEAFVDRSVDAKTLSSAMAAAKTATDVYRKAVGLDHESGATVKTNVFNIHYMKEEGSPFAKPVEHTMFVETVEEPTEHGVDDGVESTPEQ